MGKTMNVFAGWADLGGSLSLILAGFALAALLKKISLAMVFPALAGAVSGIATAIAKMVGRK